MPKTVKTPGFKSFSSYTTPVPLPNLIELQKKSYDWFLSEGLKDLFEEVSPIRDFTGRDIELYFGDHYLDEPKFNEITSKEKNITYESPLRVKVRLVNEKSGDVKEQEIYLGDFPVMTPRGTFVINGIERVVVSQLIRSPGVFFTSEAWHGRHYYGAKVIPNRGSWLEFETDFNNVIWVKIDRKRKIAISALLRAFGYGSDEEILSLFKKVDTHSHIKYIEETLKKDLSKNEAEGLKEVYKRIRPGDLATVDNARSLIHSMFFRFDRYDFGRVGRYKINRRFSLDIPNTKENRMFRRDDLVAIISEIIRLNINQNPADDIDHLGNRRVRAVGELIQNKFRIGLARMERIIRDRMSTMDITNLSPNRLINARPVIGAIKEFFMSSQLSQFMDQTNPLSELEHKRRISSMGPGGLTRERAGFEVRDVHSSYYGRICPIATPEGPNIGLVGHLASYARINNYGFIETPYRKIIKEVANKPKELEGEIVRGDITDSEGQTIAPDGQTINKALAQKIGTLSHKTIPVQPRVTQEIEYLDAFSEEYKITTTANNLLDDKGYFLNERVEARKFGKPTFVRSSEVEYMDVASNQIISVATSLIPFVEHDDAARALMGTNMQRQAVSLVSPEAPIVATGIEEKAARDSGHLIIAENDGKIIMVDASEIQILEKDGNLKTYRLNKFVRSNAYGSLNQRPLVHKSQKVKTGDVLADGPSTEGGRLALGQNIIVAFMGWEGWNYEDAIILSERLVENDKYTSVHIEHHQIDVRDTKLGPELITSDIPNVSEEKLKNLDEEGVIRIGAEVSSGDILVGKITPKGETELSAEEKLLRAIFGEKAKDVRDTSLYLEQGEHGKVVDIKIFSREAGDKLPAGVIKSIQVSVANLRKIQVGDKMAGRHGNKGVISKIVPREDMPFLPDGHPVDIILSPLGVVSRMNLGQILETYIGMAASRLNYNVISPAFNGVPQRIIKSELKRAGISENGQMTLSDGKTGEPFDNKVTVGVIYMMRLNHMVEDKIHQRSIGPYSLITQQPLGGKAQFGGQRFGEMEVWALEGYGAAHTLQEILTIKSDDVPGRSKAYEAIIKGEPINKINIPESFNVLMRELKGLCLDVELLSNNTPEDKTRITKKSNKLH